MVSVPSRASRVVLATGAGVGIDVDPDEHPATSGSTASAAATTGRTVAANMVGSRRVRMATPYGSAVRAAPHWPTACRSPRAQCDGKEFIAAEAPMVERKGEQKGPQQHAEGQHGEKTHERFREQ